MQDIPDLIVGLERSISILETFVESIAEEKMDKRRRPDFWTIAEHNSHLAHVQPMLLERMQRFQEEERPRFIPYFPEEGEETNDRPDRMETAEALAQFSHYRQKQVEVFQAADQALWQKMADHPEYDQYGFYILARHILMHDHWHMYRMEELWLTRDEYLSDSS